MNKKVVIGVLVLIVCATIFGIILNKNKDSIEEVIVDVSRNKVVVPFGGYGKLATLSIAIHGYEEKETIKDVFGVTEASSGARFVLVDASFVNISNSTFTLYPSGMMLSNKEGVMYDIFESTSGGLIGKEESAIDGRDLGPGIEERGTLVYEVPNDFVIDSIIVEKAGSNDTLYFKIEKKEQVVKNQSLDEYVVEAEEFDYISTNEVNLWKTYSDRTLVGKVKRGDAVTVTQRDSANDYCLIKKGDLEGWLACGWLQR
jgi:hypothetical protein